MLMQTLNKQNIKVMKFILSTTVLMDSINGYITMYHPGVWEQIIPLFRAILLIYFFFLISKYDSKKALLSIFIIMIVSGTSLIRFLITGYTNISLILMDLSYISKLLYFFLLLVLLVSLIQKKFIDLDWFFDVLKFNAYTMPLLIIIPTILGLERKTYAGSGFGSSGFFIANNSTNIVLIILSLYLIFRFLYVSKNKKVEFLFLFFSFIALWLQGSKTSLILLVFEIIMLCFFSIGKFLRKAYSYKRVLLFYVIFIVFMLGFIYSVVNFKEISGYIGNSLNDLILRQKYLAKINNNILDTLLSGRLTFLENVISYMETKNGLMSWLFGLGIATLPTSIIAEMDPVDIFIRLGALGLILTYGIYSYYFIKYSAIKVSGLYYKKWKQFNILLLNIALFYSIFAGHVFVDIISSTMIALLIGSLILITVDEKKPYNKGQALL